MRTRENDDCRCRLGTAGHSQPSRSGVPPGLRSSTWKCLSCFLQLAVFSTHHTTLRLVGRSNTDFTLISSYFQFHPGDSLRSPSHQQGLGARRSSLPNLVPSLPSRCATRRAWTKAGRVPVRRGESHRPRQPGRARTARTQVRALECGASGTHAAPHCPHDHGILHVCSIANSGPRESFGDGRTYHCAPNSSSLTCVHVRSRLIPLQANVPAPSARLMKPCTRKGRRLCGTECAVHQQCSVLDRRRCSAISSPTRSVFR